MDTEERAKRIAAWGWAAVTLGVEAGADRIMGLVEVTSSVRLESLKPALEAVIKSEPAGFLPSPGAVIEAAKRLAERDAMDNPRLPRGEMSREESNRWWAEANPEGWGDETWRAFIERNATDRLYAERVRRALDERHRWAADQAVREIGRRSVSHEYRIRLRRRLNVEALDHFPRPHPTADGWVPSKDFDPITALGKG